MKKILLACSFALMSLFCNADNHINKKDITTILFTSSNKIIFNLNNGTSFRGDILTKKTCPIERNFHKIFFEDDVVTNSLIIFKNSGFVTCKWDNLTKI